MSRPRRDALIAGAIASFVFALGAAQAQDLLIRNVRIIEAPGRVIERGYLLAQAGRITKVEAGKAPAPASRRC